VVKSTKTHKKIWKSEEIDMYHWIFIPPGDHMVSYSGSAPTVEQAEVDILLSAEHYIQVHSPNRQLQ